MIEEVELNTFDNQQIRYNMRNYIWKIVLLTVVLMPFTGTAKTEKKVQQPDTYAYTRGIEAYNEEKPQDALDWFNREVSEHPDNGYAYVYISSIHYDNKELGIALSAINKAIKHLPKKDKMWSSTALVHRSNIYAAMEDTVSALNDLAQAIKINPSDRKLYSIRGQIYYEQKKYLLSDAEYRRMNELDPGDIMGYMGIGRNANAEQRWDDAIAQFDYVIKIAPEYSSGYSFRAESYIAQKKWNEAVTDIVKALDIDGDDKAFYLMQHLPAEANTIMKTRLKIQMTKQPTNRYWPYCIAMLAVANEDYDEAISYFKQANVLDANSIFLEKISQCYLNLNDCNNALEYADRALAMNPDDYDVIDLRADILARLGRFEECIAERSRYVARYPEYPFAYFSRADDLMNAREFEKAIEDYNTAMVLLPLMNEFSYPFIKRGDAYRLTGKNTEAAADYNQVLSLEKDSVLSSKSWTPFAYSGLGNHDKAIETMQYIVDNDTTDLKGNLYNMVCIYARAGRNDDAVRTLEQAVSKGYKNVGHLKSDYDLDGLHDMPAFQNLIESMEMATPSYTENPDEEIEGVYETVEIPFTKEGGVTKVKCSINNLPLHFVFDTGASDVTISMVEANFMLKNDYIKPEDILGSARYVDANGDISEGTVINLRQVNFGGLELDNVRASVVRNQRAPLLLGQSVLGRLGKIEIDNPEMKLIITHKIKK